MTRHAFSALLYSLAGFKARLVIIVEEHETHWMARKMRPPDARSYDPDPPIERYEKFEWEREGYAASDPVDNLCEEVELEEDD